MICPSAPVASSETSEETGIPVNTVRMDPAKRWSSVLLAGDFISRAAAACTPIAFMSSLAFGPGAS